MSFKEFYKKSNEKPQQSSTIYGKGIKLAVTDNYEAIAKEGYQDNGLVFSIVDKLSDIFCSIPIVLEDKNGDLIEQHPILDLLNKPSRYQGKQQFLKELFSFYFLSGSSLTRKMRSSDNKPPASLYNIVSNSISPIASNIYGEIDHFRMETTGEKISVKDVIYFKSFNPLQPERGFSRIKAAGTLVDLLNSMVKFNIGLMQNSGSNAVVITSENSLSETQADSLIEKYLERVRGWKNQGKPLVAPAGIEYKPLGSSPKELEWFESLQTIWRYTCVALGVSPEMFGSDKGTTFNNRSEAYKDLMLNLIIPKFEQFLEVLNNQLLQDDYKFDNGLIYKLRIDKSAIEVLSTSQTELYNRVINAYEKGLMTYEEARIELGFDPTIKAGNESETGSTKV